MTHVWMRIGTVIGLISMIIIPYSPAMAETNRDELMVRRQADVTQERHKAYSKIYSKVKALGRNPSKTAVKQASKELLAPVREQQKALNRSFYIYRKESKDQNKNDPFDDLQNQALFQKGKYDELYERVGVRPTASESTEEQNASTGSAAPRSPASEQDSDSSSNGASVSTQSVEIKTSSSVTPRSRSLKSTRGVRQSTAPSKTIDGSDIPRELNFGDSQ